MAQQNKANLDEDDGHGIQFLGVVLSGAKQAGGSHLEEGLLTLEDCVLLRGAGNKRHDGDGELIEGQGQAKRIVLVVLHTDVEVTAVKAGQAREGDSVEIRQQVPSLAINSWVIYIHNKKQEREY